MNDKVRTELIRIARESRMHAYAPYSNYPVGAALLTTTGKVFSGVNVENAAYPTTICAERVAVFKAISDGERDFQAIAVVTSKGGPPCGSCRQVLAEFNTGMVVLIADEDGNLIDQTTVADLLPLAFTPNDLK